MKKDLLFYTVLVIFAATAVVTLLGITDVLPIRENYLSKLFYILICESVVSVVAVFKRARFFSPEPKSTPDETKKNRINLVLLPKETFARDGDPHTCRISIYNPESDEEREFPLALKRANGYLCAFLDVIDEAELIEVAATNCRNESWQSEYFSPSVTKAEMKRT